MRSRRSIAGTVLLLITCAQALHAQSEHRSSNPLGDDDVKAQILAGPVAGMALNYHSGGFRTIGDVSCPVFTGGSGMGFLAGATVEYIPSGAWSLITRFTYESRPGKFTQRLPDANVLLPDRQTVVVQEVSATSDVIYRMINADIVYSQQVLELSRNFHISVSAGPVFGYVFQGKVTQVEDLERPLNATFVNPNNLPTENNGRRLIFAKDAKIDGLNAFRVSVKGGANAEIGLFRDDWILYPGIYYDFGLTHVTRNENWNLNSLIVQIELRHAL